MEPTVRFRLSVQYDGTAFHGWQVQPSDRTVQGELERVLSRLFDRPTRVLGSGRTDTGVHATGQVAVVDGPRKWTAERLQRALNALLPVEVRIPRVTEAPQGFHPRYDATSRAYRYRVGTTPAARSPFHAPWCWLVDRPIDRARLDAATAMLVGEHSFLAFAKAGQEERGDRCHVTRAEWLEWPGLGLELRIAANRFLHHMVRYLAGTLVAIGSGEREVREMAELLAGTDDLLTSPPAPARGLFLVQVAYPGEPEDELATRSLPSPDPSCTP
jgi:tRNA pseudouridine38-40 synthase